MAGQADKSLPNYPAPIGGSSLILITTHQGNANYQAGGYTISANQFGWGRFDYVSASQSFNHNNTGNYYANIYYPVAQAPAVTSGNIVGDIPSGSNNVTIKWFAANGTEAANNSNLATEFVRIKYIGG